MVRDELQFDFKHGNIMEHVGILSHKITEGFQEVAATLRLNAVFDKELGTDEAVIAGLEKRDAEQAAQLKAAMSAA